MYIYISQTKQREQRKWEKEFSIQSVQFFLCKEEKQCMFWPSKKICGYKKSMLIRLGPNLSQSKDWELPILIYWFVWEMDRRSGTQFVPYHNIQGYKNVHIFNFFAWEKKKGWIKKPDYHISLQTMLVQNDIYIKNIFPFSTKEKAY